jgi:hypothetical protein
MERIRNSFLQCSMDPHEGNEHPHEGNEHPHEGNEQLRLTPTEGNEQMPIYNLVLNTIGTTTEEEIIMVLETKVVGTVTYKRLSEWFDNDGAWVPSAHVVCSDSETGHGWGGQMTKQRWDSK